MKTKVSLHKKFVFVESGGEGNRKQPKTVGSRQGWNPPIKIASVAKLLKRS
jgi:hypothetical protein